MGLGDRGYWSQDQGGGYRFGGRGMQFGFPKPTKAVKTLLIINVAAFVVQLLLGRKIQMFFGATGEAFWQVWRYITFQFLHSTDGLFHIIFNMLGLYMLGTPLESRLGTRGFVRFYLSCGAFGGIVYVIVANVVGMTNVPIIGASGGVYAIVLAAAVFFPHFKLLFFFFPVPIRLASALIFGGMIFIILRSVGSGDYSNPKFWSDVCHLGGAVAAAFWIWCLPAMSQKVSNVKGSLNEGAWQRKMDQRRKEEQEIDHILAKIKEKGITSLSEKEKRTLKVATKHQQEEERKMYRS